MPNALRCEPDAADKTAAAWAGITRRALPFLVLGAALLAGCTPQTAPPQAAAAPVQALPFEDAVLSAANTVFSTAPSGGGTQTVVIDPLVDGVTGEQTTATRQIAARIADLVAQRYPHFRVEPFSAEAVNRNPLVVVGTFTPVNAQGQTSGDREAFRFCLVMVDLRAGRNVAKGVARARMQGVDNTRTAFFRDSPGWSEDANVKSYIATCQGTKVGDPISPVYISGIMTASLISQAIDAYNAGRYQEALALYRLAQNTPAGNQLRVYNGVYLTDTKLGRREEATDAFGRLVDYGLANNRLAVKLLFRAGSTAFVPDPQISGAYDMWLRQIASHSAARAACLQVTGHSSRSGSPLLNERLSQLRAEYVKTRLEGDTPTLQGHVIADGAGSKENLIGTGTDDAGDALDRRVEFKVLPRC